MMKFYEYQGLDGLGMAALVAQRQVSAPELMQLALQRLEAVNPALNAVVTRMDDMAHQRAASALAGPFAGVPFLLKDVKQDHAGVVTTGSCRALRGHVPQVHAEITRRWLAAGVVPMGLSNASEFGLKPQSESAQWGAVHNPWRLGLSAGGSSGGAAAAVAAGIVPIAGGNDMGGSIRQPAALCGLFGFKPSRGRTPWGAPEAEMMQGMALQHVLSRSVRDSAAMLDATQGPMVGAPFHIAPPERPYLQELQRDPGALRIGFCTHSPLPSPISEECQAAVHHTARLLDALGHHVEEASPAFDWRGLMDDFMTMLYAGAAMVVQSVRQSTGCGDDAFEPDTRLVAAVGRSLSAAELMGAQHRLHAHHCAWHAFRQRFDVWLTPVVSTVRLPIGALRSPAWQERLALLGVRLGLARQLMRNDLAVHRRDEALGYQPFLPCANLLGLPAMSVPLHWTDDGLPVGVQCMGGVGEEGLLFQLAAQLERAQPWMHRVPGNLSPSRAS